MSVRKTIFYTGLLVLAIWLEAEPTTPVWQWIGMALLASGYVGVILDAGWRS